MGVVTAHSQCASACSLPKRLSRLASKGRSFPTAAARGAGEPEGHPESPARRVYGSDAGHYICIPR